MTNEISLSQKLINYLEENCNIYMNGEYVVIDSITLKGRSYSKAIYDTYFQDKRVISKIDSELLMLSDAMLADKIKTEIGLIRNPLEMKLKAQALEEVKASSEIDTDTTKYHNYKPVVDITSKYGDAFIVDKRTCHVVDVTERAWNRLVGPEKVQMESKIPAGGRFEYDPNTINPVKDASEYDAATKIYNKYIPPHHRFKRNRDVKLDPRAIKFFETFFEDSCRTYAYNWIYHSAFTRIPIYLVLVGRGGIGKNFLAEVLKTIHGATNFNKAPQSSLSNRFNSHLADCTMVYYDECKFSAGPEGKNTRKNKLKEWANEYVPIEMKNVDARDANIYCSAIIATNNESDVHLDSEDRKFSVMELCKDRMEIRLGKEDTIFLWEYLKDPLFPDAVLNYLENIIDKDFNVQVEYKGPMFESLVISSLSTWQSDIREVVIGNSDEKIALDQLKDKWSVPPKLKKIEDFINNHTESNGEKLGEFVKVEGRPYIKINEKFLAPKNDMDLEE